MSKALELSTCLTRNATNVRRHNANLLKHTACLSSQDIHMINHDSCRSKYAAYLI